MMNYANYRPYDLPLCLLCCSLQLLPKEQWLPAFALEALIQPAADADVDDDDDSSTSVPKNSLAAISGMASLPGLGSLRPTGAYLMHNH